MIEADPGVDFADSNLISYECSRKDNCLTIKINTWNDCILKIKFYDLLFIADRGGDDITAFCIQNVESSLLKEVLEKNYDQGKIPDDHPYKLYHFLGLYDEPVMDIVCQSFEIQKFNT